MVKMKEGWNGFQTANMKILGAIPSTPRLPSAGFNTIFFIAEF